ncbi:hypothetical protein CHARACLAT_020165 [Characodon lateralis]|uniref:Uncharacterized protein n=1 Tax=Characodon lateralis TaxID=208331 RepID=A0ABU7F4I0_9TELE|nr:hypothetical protein [Characodon lateralis]
MAGQHRSTQDKQPCTHSFTPKGNAKKPINLTCSHVFGLWEDAGVPGDNPPMHRENMQTPCRKPPNQESKPRTFLLQSYQLCYGAACVQSIIQKWKENAMWLQQMSN